MMTYLERLKGRSTGADASMFQSFRPVIGEIFVKDGICIMHMLGYFLVEAGHSSELRDGCLLSKSTQIRSFYMVLDVIYVDEEKSENSSPPFGRGMKLCTESHNPCLVGWFIIPKCSSIIWIKSLYVAIEPPKYFCFQLDCLTMAPTTHIFRVSYKGKFS